MTQRDSTGPIRFTAAPEVVASALIVRLPRKASELLPSRGQVAVEGTIEGTEFATVVEPDGLRGHWLKLDRDLQRAVSVRAGNSVAISLELAQAWPEPHVPADLKRALADAPDEIRARWRDITPMARWEWVRWVNATATPATRARRVEVTVSKLDSGKRRPCCFDLSACTDPALAKNGKLRGAAERS